MAYEVLARKWRPRQFDDVVGQNHVTQTLRNAITSKRIANAYLFVGPRGIGKTSLARIFSKALNCDNGPTVTPCDKCSSCIEISSGTGLDVLEIDGASNNSVEQVRELRETVKYAPTHGSYKIYIIDEVHMLSTAAFNALLKTLEEPPPHVKFIFATTEPDKILPTILSRCQRFDLRRIPVPVIVDRLKMIAAAEKISIEPDAMLAIARGCEGGLRDAVSALDQLVSFKGSNIKEEDVLSVFGLASRSVLENMAEKILQGDVKSIIEAIASIDESGKDLQKFILELMGHFRNLLVWIHVKDASSMELLEAQVETLKKQSALTGSERLLRIAEILSETENRMKYALSRRTLLETALIRCARAATVVSIEDLLKQINELKSGLGSEPDTVKTAPQSPLERDTAFRSITGGGQMNAEAVIKEPAGNYEPVKHEAPKSAPGDQLEFLLGNWGDIVEKIAKMAVGTKSLLLDARPLEVDDVKVVIGVEQEFASEMERLESPRNKKAIEHVLGTALKHMVAVVFKVSGSFIKEGTGMTVQEVKRKATPAPAPAKGQPRTKRELIDDPAVQKALDVFDGTILDVRE